MKPALVIVDMLKDTFTRHPESTIVLECRKFIPHLNAFIDLFHERKYPVIFACDSFLPDDFIFKARLKPHSLRGTKGSEPIDELHRFSSDHILPKRRFSAFFKTDLDQTLRTLGVDTVFVAGIATNICVLTTALDAVSNDFSAVIMEQCCAAHTTEAHLAVVQTYRATPLYPLLQVLSNEECLKILEVT